MNKILTLLLLGFVITKSFGQYFKQEHKFRATSPKENDKYGASVALNSNYYFVGATLDDESVVGTTDETSSNGGALYVYNYDNSLHQKIFPSVPTKSAYFGNSIAVNGAYLVVGAYYGKHDATASAKEGLAYVFTKNSSNQWEEKKILKQSTPKSYDLFGRDVAISGSYILSTANGEDETESGSGAGYIFFKDEGGTNNWGQQAKLKATDAQKNAYLGWSGDLSGDYAVLGAYRYDTDTKTDVGAAYVFKRTGTTWTQDALLLPSTAKAGDYVGYDVAIEGNYIVVAAKNAEVNNFEDAGQVYLYEKDTNGAWNLAATLQSPNPTSNETFGFKVAIDNQKIYVSAKGFNNYTGKAYEFTKGENGWVSKEIQRKNPYQEDNFGTSIAAFNNKVLIGSDEGTNKTGAAFLFKYLNPFSEVNTSIENFFYASLDWGDYDNDGYKDLVISGAIDVDNDDSADQSVVKLYKNDGANNFTEVSIPNIYGLHLGAIKFADVDNDKDLDIIVTGQNYTHITKYFTTVYENNAGVFTEKQQLDGVIYSSLSFGDYDNNGTQDMLVSGAFQAHSGASVLTKIYKNTNGIFADSGIVLPGIQNGNAEFGDIDNDGDLDIVMMGYDENSNSILKTFTNANAVFTEKQNLSGIALGGLSLADFDNDGDLDFAIMGDDINYDYTAKVFKNTNGTFADFATLTGLDSSSGTTHLQWGDYNNDGFTDLIMAGTDADYNEVTALYENKNGTEFLKVASGITNTGGNTTLGWADFDLDNDLDIALSGWYTDARANYKSGTFLFKNNTRATNIKPNAPTNLSVTKNASNLVFSWEAPTDDTTPSTALQYYLQVTNATTHKLVASYKVLGTSWALKNLSTGNYDWSVQAIDAAYVKSNKAIGEQQSLSVKNEIQVNAINVYPNPAKDFVTISGIQNKDITSVTIFSMQGKKMNTIYKLKNNRIDVSGLSSGVYFIKVAKENTTIHKKIIIK